MNSHQDNHTHINQQNAAIENPSTASIAGNSQLQGQHQNNLDGSSTVPGTGAPSTFTTTDASGYPDKHDGLSAHNSTHNNVIVDPHEHHKHHQVQDTALATGAGVAAAAGHAHTHAHKPIPGHSATGHLHGHESLVGQPLVEIAEQVRDPTLPMDTTPMQTTVPNFLR
ncbi:hypothetical protein EDD11_000795 [Mortierella claussenii]|nr:hypothetical protein EDD11_000795 [Mortierella claussenii]